jgi:hypothetical protein
MILNGYSVLALFAGAVEFALGLAVVLLAVRARRAQRGREGAAAGRRDGAPGSLLPLASGALLGVSLASWPLLYLLLASYVPQWRDVMCIQGVARIGQGSLGAPGWLPTLVGALQVTKPLLVFATGAWLVLHLADRRTTTSPLGGRVLVAVALAGAIAAVDAAVQVAYVAIPKQEQSLSVGCCLATGPAGEVGPVSRAGYVGSGARPRTALVLVFYAASAALAAWTGRAGFRRAAAGARPPAGTVPLLFAALATLPVGVLFLRNVAAPAFLGLPDHTCAYCLVGSEPLGLLAIALFLLGVLATAWSCLAARLADVPETREFLPRSVASGLRWASFGWAGAAVLTAVQVFLL